MLKLLHLDSSQTRRQRFARHFSNRFIVHSAATVAEADRLVDQHTPHILVSYCQLPDGHAFDFATTLRETQQTLVVLVQGAPQVRRKRRASPGTVDVYSAELLSPSMMEGLVWNAVVRRHAPSQNKAATEHFWKTLLQQEPLLQQVLPLVCECADGGDPVCLAEKLQKVLHTRHTTGREALPFVVIVDDDRARRDALQEHFAGRLRLYFVLHPQDLIALHQRQSVSAVVFQVPGATPALIRQLRGLSDFHVPMVAHGLSDPLSIDRQVKGRLTLPALEALLFEELTSADPRVFDAGRPKSAISTQSASLSEDEIAQRSSWGDLLTAEANLTNLKRLFIKQINLHSDRSPPTETSEDGRPLSELSWGELLKSDVNRATVTELFTRDIQLFPRR